MKNILAKTTMIVFTAFASMACNDEVRNDHDRDRAEENNQQLPGGQKPSEFTDEYNTQPNNNTNTPDSNRNVGSQVDTIHGLQDNQP